MRTLFQVPINGSFPTLLALALPFVLTMLGIGLLHASGSAMLTGTGRGASFPGQLSAPQG